MSVEIWQCKKCNRVMLSERDECYNCFAVNSKILVASIPTAPEDSENDTTTKIIKKNEELKDRIAAHEQLEKNQLNYIKELEDRLRLMTEQRDGFCEERTKNLKEMEKKDLEYNKLVRTASVQEAALHAAQYAAEELSRTIQERNKEIESAHKEIERLEAEKEAVKRRVKNFVALTFGE